MKSFILVLGIAISSILHSKANNLSDTTQLINAIQYFNAQTLNLCCSDSITIVNTIILVRNQFEEVINNYPNSYLKDDTQYFIGKIYQYGYTPQNQIIEWQKIIDLYPGQFFSTITTGSSWYSNYPNPGLSFVPSDAWAMQQVAGGLLTPVNYTLGFQMIDTIVAHFPDICQSAEALLMKGDYYNGLGQRYDAVEKYEEVLDLFPQCLATCGYAYDRIGAMMAAIGDWAVIDTFRQKLENEYCIDNHLAEGNFAILQNNRWNKPTPFVLSIYANASNAIDSMLVDSVITIYETMFPNVLSFNWVPEQGQGGNPYNGVDIEIEFWPYGFNYAQVGGFGFYPYREIYRSIIHVSNTPSFTSRLKTLIHEMGHSLGLGHSFNNEDIMFFSTSQVAEPMLSERDSVTLQMLYSPLL
ncbi:MAG: matrixin family metalloprotease [Saprospiraceae bacterium]|nr:matrixin family metalloprotease [Saprospiraceae bacterium]